MEAADEHDDGFGIRGINLLDHGFLAVSSVIVVLSIPSLPSLFGVHTPHPAPQVGWFPTKTMATFDALAALTAALLVLSAA